MLQFLMLSLFVCAFSVETTIFLVQSFHWEELDGYLLKLMVRWGNFSICQRGESDREESNTWHYWDEFQEGIDYVLFLLELFPWHLQNNTKLKKEITKKKCSSYNCSNQTSVLLFWMWGVNKLNFINISLVWGSTLGMVFNWNIKRTCNRDGIMGKRWVWSLELGLASWGRSLSPPKKFSLA